MMPPIRLAHLKFEGGCDFVTPPLSQPPGRLRLCQNLEIGVEGGYDSLKGYERFDGRPAPSDATYTVLPCSITGTIAVGNTVTGASSGATGYVIVVGSGFVAVTKKTGTFTSSENLTVSAVVQAAMTAAEQGGAATAALDAEYRNLAANVYRADIGAVPGSGPIRGVCKFGSAVYAWRDNVGATALALYKSSGSGWTSVSLGREIAFTSGGTYEIQEGDTITGATSGATAVVRRIAISSGTWAASDAAGRLMFASQTGTFQSESLNVGANLNVATIAGNSAAIALSPGGRVRHDTYNFGGAAGTRRVYGADGINRAFEFDGTYYWPIATGMDADTPKHIKAHKNRLFLSFGSSAQCSEIGEPHSWQVVLGADEKAIGDTITGFSIEGGSETDAALGIHSRNTIHMLYGNDETDWQMIQFRREIGSFDDSIQDMGVTISMDDRGLGSFRATNAFGNFQGATLSTLVQPWLNTRKSSITDSCIVRDKNQYRAFFNDETALYVTFRNGKVLGMMTELLGHKVECVHSAESTDGNEEIYFGSDDGYVYQMEKGTSFDGDPIVVFGMVNYWHAGSPSVLKRYKGARLEASGSGYAEFSLGYEIGYSTPDLHQPTSTDNISDFTQGQQFLEARWDTFSWDSFYWDGVAVAPASFSLCGSAENIGFIIYSSSDEFSPVKYSGLMMRYVDGRVLR